MITRRRRHPDWKDWVILIAIIIGFVALVGGSLLWNAKAPCSAFKYVTARDVPARCLSYFTDSVVIEHTDIDPGKNAYGR